MEKMIFEGVELGFNDLSKQTQEKLYLQDKKKFEEELAKSQYASIRKLLIKDEECEASILDEIFKVEIEIYKNVENIVQIWNHPKFERTDEKRKALTESNDWEIRMIAAKDEGSSSEFLNEMLRKEMQKEQDEDEDVIIAILDNENFKMNVETFSLFANSEIEDDRETAGSYMEDSICLNQLLRSEVEGKDCQNVIDAILENECFEMEEKTLEVLANSKRWENRQWAAREETDCLKLTEMWQKEVQSENDADVLEAIRNNPNFQVEAGNFKKFADSQNWEDRLMAVKSKYATVEILEEMYLKEDDSDVLEAIEEKLDKKVINNHVQLSFMQKVRIRKVLEKCRNSKCSISKCLNEILEIIS